jgi:hypothetical protein
LILRAGQQELSGLLSLAYDAIQTITLYVTLRPYSEVNRDLLTGLQATTQIVFTPLAAPEERALPFALTDLSPLGDTRYDREVELVVWQAYLPPAVVSFGHRLVGVELVTSVVDTRAREAERSELPRQGISYADIKTGAILGQDLGRKLRDTHNGLLRGLLGRAPGLTNDDRSDTTRSYRQEVVCAHEHQGIDVPDGCGSFVSDGAVRRDTLFAIPCAHASNLGTFAQDYQGVPLHLSGIFDAASLRLEARASIPSGLGAIDIRFCLRSESRQQVTRLLVHVDVRGFDGVSIATDVASGVHRQESELDSDGLYVCEVDPLDNNLFVPMRRRRLARAGLWTLAALRDVPGLLLASTPTNGMRPSNHQISETVRINLTHPKLRPLDTPHQTADYIVVLRWEMQTVEGLTPVDPGTKLQWVLGLPSRGF